MSLLQLVIDGIKWILGQSKMLIISTNVDKKSLETEFLIAVCCPTGNKWLSKTLFLWILDLRLMIVKSIFDCPLSSVALVDTSVLAFVHM